MLLWEMEHLIKDLTIKDTIETLSDGVIKVASIVNGELFIYSSLLELNLSRLD